MSMMMTLEIPTLDEQIEEIMESFEFGLVHCVFVSMGWKWSGVDEATGAEGFTPSEDDLRITARRMLREVAGREGNSSLRVCGFVAKKRDGYLNLYFVEPEDCQ